MNIEILGTGCAKCIALENNTKEAIKTIGGFHNITKVDDVMKIMEYNVISTPGFVVDGKVLSSGKLLSVNEIIDLLK